MAQQILFIWVKKKKKKKNHIFLFQLSIFLKHLHSTKGAFGTMIS
jgi:hypothetical protein